MEEIKYIHIEDINECCICYEIFNESFRSISRKRLIDCLICA